MSNVIDARAVFAMSRTAAELQRQAAVDVEIDLQMAEHHLREAMRTGVGFVGFVFPPDPNAP